MMVNDQLHQLYIEMELEGLSKALTLEEAFSSSSSSSDDNPSSNSNSTGQNRVSFFFYKTSRYFFTSLSLYCLVHEATLLQFSYDDLRRRRPPTTTGSQFIIIINIANQLMPPNISLKKIVFRIFIFIKQSDK